MLAGRDTILGFDTQTKTVKYIVDNKFFYSTDLLRAYLHRLGFTQSETQQYITALYVDTSLSMNILLHSEFKPYDYMFAVPCDVGVDTIVEESTHLPFTRIPRMFFDIHIAWETQHGAVIGSSGVLALNATPIDIEATAYRQYRPKDASWLDVYNECAKYVGEKHGNMG